MRPITPAAFALVLALAACSHGRPAAAPVTTPSSAAPAVTSATPSAALSSPAAAARALNLGQTHRFTDQSWKATVTALAHKRQAGYEGVQVRTCNEGTTEFDVSTAPWLLSYGGGEQLVDVTGEGGGLLSPPFVARTLTAGKCAKGWISFEPASGKPDGVEYRVEGVTSARWEW